MSAGHAETARFNMIEQQIRPCDITSEAVLRVLQQVPREHFVPDIYRNLAFADTAIPLDHQHSMMTPIQEAILLQALAVHPGDKVLEIGTSSGFLTACLTALGGHVTSYEIAPELHAQAVTALHQHDPNNLAELVIGDIFQAELPSQHFDAIAVTGSVSTLPELFLSWLAPGGRMFCVVGEEPIMQAQQITHQASGKITSINLCEMFLVPLQHIAASKPFAF
jgi:protein-L-isoaspartate(D-aspartate) O-methyltransferase